MTFHVVRKIIPDHTVFQFVDLADIEFPVSRAGLAYWQKLRGARRFPARTEIKPRDITGTLHHMALIKVDGDDFIYRIVGDAVVRAYDVTIQNRRISDIAVEEPGFGSYVAPTFRKVVETGIPVAVRGTTGHDVSRANFTDYESVIVPLGPDGATVDHLMTFSSYLSRPLIPSRG